MQQHQEPIAMLAPTLGLTISRGKRGGWVVWNAGDSDVPTAYCTTLPEAWGIASQLMAELGRQFEESPYVPQAPPQLQYQPQPQQPPYPPRAPASYQPPEEFPNVVERGSSTRNLADQIAAVQRNGKVAANGVAVLFIAGVALMQAWPFGA